jgi:hypothetical protein
MHGSLELRSRPTRHRERTFAVITALAPLVSGCFLVAAGAGAGGGVYLTTRGVRSVIAAPVASVASATERAFTDLGLKRTELRVEGNGEKQELKAQPEGGEPEVTVTLERSGGTSTDVEVTARTGAVTWDKDYARRVLDKIMERSREAERSQT